MANDANQKGSAGGGATTTAAFSSISAISAGWFAAVLIAVALTAFVVATVFLPTNSLGFAALAGTAILSVSLTALIIVFRAIGIMNPDAALGLPRGSVRALLAFGLTIVFVAIASWTLGGMFDPLGPLVAQTTISSKDQDAYKTYHTRYPDTDYIFTETPLGVANPQSSVQAPTSRAADQPAAPAVSATDLVSLKVYLKRKAQDPNAFELAKQIMTTIATVLVTIVGFYFGSHSSADASRTLSDALSGKQNASGSPQPAAQPSSPDDLDKMANAVSALAVSTKAKLDSLGNDPLALLSGAVAGAASNDSQLAAKLAAAQQAFEEMQKSAAACATDADRATDARAGLAANAGADQVKELSDRLKALLADATQSNDGFEQKWTQWTDARNSILQRTAKG